MFVGTVFSTIVALNFTAGEKEVRQDLDHHHNVADAQFLRSMIGSTNFDNRSFRLNDEANLNVHDRDFAGRQIAVFNDDLKHSTRVTYEEWLARPWTQKVWQKALTTFNTQL
jgi:cardiolipin synthase